METPIFHELIQTRAHEFCEELITGTSILGCLLRYIKSKNFFRDAQYSALEIYFWIKEKAQLSKLSDLILSGMIYEDYKPHGIVEKSLLSNKNYAGLFLLNYFKKLNKEKFNIEDIEDTLLDLNLCQETLLDILNEFDYSNYLYSLPMGAGKTYLIAAFIYIDAYLYDKYTAINDDRAKYYGANSIVLIPNAKKNSISPSLSTISKFNPNVLFSDELAKEYKNKIRIRLIDESDNKKDKLISNNPNLTKIQQTIVGHYYYNVFIINAEKINGLRPDSDDDFYNLNQARQTLLIKAEDIRNILSTLPNLNIYIDEAHHVYDNEDNQTELRKAILSMYQNKEFLSCICVSGTPYLKRSFAFKFGKSDVMLNDIQDTVYYYPLSNGINNFLKKPVINVLSEKKIVSDGLTMFFNDFDKIYDNGCKSKIAIYCIDSTHLIEVKREVDEWCDVNGYDKNSIVLPYYSEDVKGAPKLPKENKYHFDNLDNPSASHRIILLIGIGTEGWDCKSLTGVMLPRKKSGKIFVLQSSTRCLREVDDARFERAFICLTESNRKILSEELHKKYNITISEFETGNTEIPKVKKYPIRYASIPKRKLEYNSIKLETQFVYEQTSDKVQENLKKFSLGKFQNLYKYDFTDAIYEINQGEVVQIAKTSPKKSNCNISEVEFMYTIVRESFGFIDYNDLIKIDKVRSLYLDMLDNFLWFDRHPRLDIVEKYAHEIAKLFIPHKVYERIPISSSTQITLYEWHTNNPAIMVSEQEADKVVPEVSWNKMPLNGDEKLIDKAFSILDGKNKNRMFSYYPLKTDSSFEINLIEEMLNEDLIFNKSYELYYNGYNGANKIVGEDTVELEKFQILTDYGIYTPDFLLLQVNDNVVSKILIIETKSEVLSKDESFILKQNFVKEYFLKDSENKNKFDYITIGDIKNNKIEYNRLKNKIKEFIIDV